jgi:hypothetical protein
MEKKLTFKDKIDIVLKIKGLKLKDIEDALNKEGTFYKAYKDNREPTKRILNEFLLKFQISASWWKNPVGVDEGVVFEAVVPIKKEGDDINNHPLVKSYLREIANLNRIIEMQEKEIARLSGGKH